MKRLISTLLLSLLAVSVFAQKDGKATISNVSIKKADSTVQVSFDAMIERVASDYQLQLTPVLFNDSLRKSLAPIVIMGKTKAVLNRRYNRSVDQGNSWVAGKEKTLIPYELSIPYEPWMNQLSLNIDRAIQACGNELQLASYNMVRNQLIHFDIKPIFDTVMVQPEISELQKFDKTASFLYPATDYDRRYEIFKKKPEIGALSVYFKQGRWSIDSSYKNNQQTLTLVNKVLGLIEADPYASLKKIVIIGLASPQGPIAKNDILAEKRATSLKYFVGARVKYDPNLIELINGSMENFPPKLTAGYVQIYYESTPDVNVEKINNATKLISDKQYDTALPLLLSVTGDKQLENKIGVCYMMTGDYDQAITYFEQAITKGNGDAENAVANLEQIRIVQSIQ